MSVSSSVVSLSRRGGRTSGQLSALDGSRTPSDGDRVSEARIIVSEKTTWTHLRESISAFYGEKRICNFNGCTDEMIPRYKRSKFQFYYRCCTPSSIGLHNDRQKPITKGSIFFNKSDISKVCIVLSEYFRKASIATIINTVRNSGPTASQLAVDWQMLMHNDFIRYFGDYKLGDNELYDHIQIDESKLGKQTHHTEIHDSQEDRHETSQFEHNHHSDASSSENNTDDEDCMPPTLSAAVIPGMIDPTAPIMDAMTDLAGRSSLKTPTTREHRRSRRVHRT
ncbi:hypothetical protein G6F46_011112 [Rhizopus delemar]|nr:hypothetical protein G6F46_011112 [Rhizopus delemar]